MAERYSRLSSLPENQYTVGAPILIAAGALLKDNQTGKALAQIKFRSISDKQIKALKISVIAYDVSGKEVKGVPEYQYLDLNVIRNTEFGQKQAVTLPDAVTRSFVVKCTDVFFADGTAWAAAPEAHWDVLPRLETITDKLGSLADQYQRDTSTRSRFAPVEYHDLWYCACGALNHDGESECHACRQEKEKLFTALNLEALDQRNEDYKAAEAEKAAKKAEADKIRRNKSKKIALIAATIIAVIVVVSLLTTKVIIPNTKYNNAVALMEAGQYEEAIAAFNVLGNYKDSADLTSECYYKAAVELMNDGNYEKAIAAFEDMNGYKDSVTKIDDCNLEITYQDAIAMATTNPELSYQMFKTLGDYKDTQQYCDRFSFVITEAWTEDWHVLYEYEYSAEGKLVSILRKLPPNTYLLCDVKFYFDDNMQITKTESVPSGRAKGEYSYISEQLYSNFVYKYEGNILTELSFEGTEKGYSVYWDASQNGPMECSSYEVYSYSGGRFSQHTYMGTTVTNNQKTVTSDYAILKKDRTLAFSGDGRTLIYKSAPSNVVGDDTNVITEFITEVYFDLGVDSVDIPGWEFIYQIY